MNTSDKRLESILKESLIGLYYDDWHISEALRKLDYSYVGHKFRKELAERISQERFAEVDTFLNSSLFKEYKKALDESVLACTKELADLVYFVTTSEGGEQ